MHNLYRACGERLVNHITPLLKEKRQFVTALLEVEDDNR
jgi:hypothetical protein